jgi:hypothetical protein
MPLLSYSARSRCNINGVQTGVKSQGIPSTIGVNSRVIARRAVGTNRDKIYYGNQVGGIGIKISSKSKCGPCSTHLIYNKNPYIEPIIDPVIVPIVLLRIYNANNNLLYSVNILGNDFINSLDSNDPPSGVSVAGNTNWMDTCTANVVQSNYVASKNYFFADNSDISYYTITSNVLGYTLYTAFACIGDDGTLGSIVNQTSIISIENQIFASNNGNYIRYIGIQ